MSDWEAVLLPAPMRAYPVANAVHGWLKQVSFDRLVELYWMAQAERADEEDTYARRKADSDDMAYKTAAYVEEYYNELGRKRLEQVQPMLQFEVTP